MTIEEFNDCLITATLAMSGAGFGFKANQEQVGATVVCAIVMVFCVLYLTLRLRRII